MAISRICRSEHEYRVSPRNSRGRGGLVPIAWPIALLLRRAGCDQTIVAGVLTDPAIVSNDVAAPPGAGSAPSHGGAP